MKISTWYKHIRGPVQRVEFRPFAYKQVQSFELNGWGNNTADGVHVESDSEEEMTTQFYKFLVENASRLSRITFHEITKMKSNSFPDHPK